MDIERNFHKHSIALLAVFVFGNIIISFPKGEGRHQGLWGYLACFIFALCLSRLYAFLQSKNIYNLIETNCKTLKNIFILLFITFAVLCYFICCKDYVNLIDEVRLPQTSSAVISVVFITLTALIASLNKKIIYLLAVPATIFLCLVTVITFVLSAPNFNLKLLINNLNFDFGDFGKQGLTFFIHSFGQIIIIVFFFGNKQYKSAKKIHLYGVFLGCFVLMLCLLNVIFVLGTAAIDSFDYPYATVTGIIMLGKAYSRMDGLTYYIYFICSLLKASVILNVIISFFEILNRKLKKVSMLAIPLLSIIFATSKLLNSVLQSKGVNFIILIFEITIPALLIIMAKRKPKLTTT